jgi:hypothetical protein
MTYKFPGTAEAVGFEDTVSAMRHNGRYRKTNRDGRTVWVQTFGRSDFERVDTEARSLGGSEYVGVAPEDRF